MWTPPCVARLRSNKNKNVRTEKVMAGLYRSSDGRMLMMLALITSSNPNSEVTVVKKIRMNKSPAHNHPEDKVARAASTMVTPVSQMPDPVMDTRLGSPAKLLRLMVWRLCVTPSSENTSRMERTAQTKLEQIMMAESLTMLWW